jgi:hypothetical protein
MRPPLLHTPPEPRSTTPQDPQSRPRSLPLPESRSPGLLPPESHPIVSPPLQSRPPVHSPPETRPVISSPSQSHPILSPSPESILNASLPHSQSHPVASQTPPFIGPIFYNDFQLPPPIDAASVMRVHPFSSFNPGLHHNESQSAENPDHPMAEASNTIHEAIKDFEESMQAIQGFGDNSNNLDGGEIKDLEMSCIDYSPQKHKD